MYTPHYDLSRLGVITAVFNPVRYRSQYERYHKFAYHMTRSGVTLFTIECIFDSAMRFGLPLQRFEVTRPDNPHHFQVVASSIMWMKENLINIAVQRLPPHIDRIAWIDPDVEFERPDWPLLTMHALERYPIVQMFKLAYVIGSGGKQQILRRDVSFAYSVRRRKPLQLNHPQWYVHPGYAWAMHRATFDAIGGLLDFCIVGSDDLHFAYGLLGRIQETFPSSLHPDYRMVAKSWGERVASVAGRGAAVGYVDVNLYHRWHGSRENRSHIRRWLILSLYQFSPTKDLARNNHSGVIYLANKRRYGSRSQVVRIEGIERAIVNYILSRDEDNRRALSRRSVPQYRIDPAPQQRRSGSPNSVRIPRSGSPNLVRIPRSGSPNLIRRPRTGSPNSVRRPPWPVMPILQAPMPRQSYRPEFH